MEKTISMLDAFSDIIIQISKMPACTEELKHIASVIEQTRREMAMQENGTVNGTDSGTDSGTDNNLNIKSFDRDSGADSGAVNDTPISRPEQYLGSMQVDEDGCRFASSDSCHHDQCRRMERK